MIFPVLAAAAVLAPTTTPGGECVVPRLYTVPVHAATAQLDAAGCRVGAIVVSRARGRRATVVSQVPGPGAVLPPGARVALVVSRNR